MNILQYPDAMKALELQIWNNAAFDNDESEVSAAIKASWSSLHQSSDSLHSNCSKENLSPEEFAKTPVPVKSSVSIGQPLQQNSTVVNWQVKPPKLLFKEGLLLGRENQEEGDKAHDEKKIDSEIAEIEKEISRLSTRLEALRIEKAKRNAKMVQRRGRIVQAKFLQPPVKQSEKNSEAKTIEENLPPSSAKTNVNRRGLSLGPAEIVASSGLRRLIKLEITPVQAIQNRRKSCFWKLQDIDELRATKERGKSLSLSPKSRKTVSKILPLKQPATTVCSSKRLVKKEEAILSAIQPKKLFKEGEKSMTAKKPVRPGRVVASRYNSGMNDGRKRSLPEDDNDGGGGKRCDRKRLSLVGKQRGNVSGRSQGTEGRVKKKWEIPSEVVVFRSLEDEVEEAEKLPLPATEIGDVLPRIRTFRYVNESPRDSGPEKRVAELIGRRSYFCPNEEKVEGSSICQALTFGKEDEAVKNLK